MKTHRYISHKWNEIHTKIYTPSTLHELWLKSAQIRTKQPSKWVYAPENDQKINCTLLSYFNRVLKIHIISQSTLDVLTQVWRTKMLVVWVSGVCVRARVNDSIIFDLNIWHAFNTNQILFVFVFVLLWEMRLCGVLY